MPRALFAVGLQLFEGDHFVELFVVSEEDVDGTHAVVLGLDLHVLEADWLVADLGR